MFFFSCLYQISPGNYGHLLVVAGVLVVSDQIEGTVGCNSY